MQVISTIIFLSLTVLFMLMGPISWGAAGGYLARRLPIRALGCLIARDLESARSNARPSIWAKCALIGLGAIFLLLWFVQVHSLSTVTSSGWSGVTGGLNSDEREIAQESDDPMFSAAMARAEVRGSRLERHYADFPTERSPLEVGTLLLGLSAAAFCGNAFLRDAGTRRLNEWAASWAEYHWRGVSPVEVSGFAEGGIKLTAYGRTKADNHLAVRQGKLRKASAGTEFGRLLRAEGFVVEAMSEERNGKVAFHVVAAD